MENNQKLDNSNLDANQEDSNVIGEYDKTNFDAVQRKLEPNPLQRQLDTPQPTYYGGTRSGFFGSVGGGIKSGLVSASQDIYNDVKWAGQHVFGSEPDESGFNFGDRMELAKMNVASTHPSEEVMFGTQFLGMAVLAVATTPIIDAIATATSVEGAIASTASTIGKVLGDRASVGTVASNLITDSTIINKANKIRDISSSSQGLIRRFSSYSASLLPFETGANINFNSKGEAHIDTTGFLADTAVNTIPFGVMEGVGALYRSTVSAGSEVTKSMDKINQIYKDNPQMEKKVSPLKTDTPLDTVREESQPFLNEKVSNASTINNLIDSAFTKEEYKQIINNASKNGLVGRISPTTMHADIRLTKEGAESYNDVMTSFIDSTTKKKLARAILSKYGVIHEGKVVDLETPSVQASISTKIKELRTFFDKSGQRKVAITDEYRKLPYNLKADTLAKKLFYTNSYANTGSKRLLEKEGVYLDNSYEGGSQILHHYPIWHFEAKQGIDDLESLEELSNMKNKHGAFLRSLLDASDKRQDEYRKGLYNNIDDTIDNSLSYEDASTILDNYQNNTGEFSDRDFSEHEKYLHDEVVKAIESDKEKFFDDSVDNKYFTKILKKLHNDKIATKKYISCMLNFI